jgi:hypothetical protein
LKGAAADQDMFKCSSNGKHAKRHQMVKWQFISSNPHVGSKNHHVDWWFKFILAS